MRPLQEKGDTLLQAIQQRCEEWAEWYSTDQQYGLGYPSRSLSHWIFLGECIPSSQGARPLPTHAAAEEIEAWVGEMAVYNPKMAKVLRVHYFHPDALRRQALRLGLSYTEFRHQLDMAHQWLAGRWSGCAAG